MKKYIHSTFNYKNINNIQVLGNKALVYLLDKDENFNKILMSQLSNQKDIPIVCFIRQINNNNYDIYYYNPDGSQAKFCGHGTLVAGFVLKQLFSYEIINFYFNKDKFLDKNIDNLIQVSSNNEGLIFLKMKKYNFNKINFLDDDYLQLALTLNLTQNDIVDAFMGIELNDFTFVLKNFELLRAIDNINFKLMAELLKKLNIRMFCITAKSITDDFDFETRAFNPQDGIDEDFVCGSSNLTISKYWDSIINKKITENFDVFGKIENIGTKNYNNCKKNKFKILFPYKINSKIPKIGGVQFVDVSGDFLIGGVCK